MNPSLGVYGVLPVCKHEARWTVGTTAHVYPVSQMMPYLASDLDGLSARQLPIATSSSQGSASRRGCLTSVRPVRHLAACSAIVVDSAHCTLTC